MPKNKENKWKIAKKTSNRFLCSTKLFLRNLTCRIRKKDNCKSLSKNIDRMPKNYDFCLSNLTVVRKRIFGIFFGKRDVFRVIFERKNAICCGAATSVPQGIVFEHLKIYLLTKSCGNRIIDAYNNLSCIRKDACDTGGRL